MNTRRFAVIVASLVLSACASSGAPTEPVVYSQAEAADSVRVRVGETIVVSNARIRFSAVESDSRCASDVVCVWAGDAVASFIVEMNCECKTPAFELKLHTTLDPKFGVAYGQRVQLLQLQPYPRSSQPTKPDEYYAWLKVTASQ